MQFRRRQHPSLAQPILVLATMLLLSNSLSQTVLSGAVPDYLLGKWKVVRLLPTRTISCWGNKDAKQVVGTTIEYSHRSIQWNERNVQITNANVRLLTAQQFHDENSGGGPRDSQIDFVQLGIREERARQITMDHTPAQLTGATTEFPGDDVLVKSPDSFVFSLCGLYFEAKRIPK